MDDLKTGPTVKPKPPNRRWLLIGAVLLVLAFIAAAVVRRENAGNDKVAAPPRDAAPTDVIQATADQLKQIQVEAVTNKVIDQDLETTGKIGFNEDRMTPVFAPYGGHVVEVRANKGDHVSAGQPLLVVESPDLVGAINDLSQARSDVDRSKIDLDAAQKAADRARSLNAQEALARKDLQAAESDLAKAREENRRALAAANVVRNRLSFFGKTTEEIAHLEATPGAKLDPRITVLAPLTGTIVDRKVGPGQYIKPDTPDPLYLISDLSDVWVNADVFESYISLIHLGAPVEISVSAYPGKVFPARISAINPTVDSNTRTIHVRCLVPNPKNLLKPEMFATVRIGNGDKRTVSTVPDNAILKQGSDSFVLVEESQGRFRKRQIQTGKETLGYTVVESGLTSQDRVVINGGSLLSGADGK